MKHLGKIQAEFLKKAAEWDDMSLEAQKDYLKEHPKSKRKVTAKPGLKDVSQTPTFDAKQVNAEILQKLKSDPNQVKHARLFAVTLNSPVLFVLENGKRVELMLAPPKTGTPGEVVRADKEIEALVDAPLYIHQIIPYDFGAAKAQIEEKRQGLSVQVSNEFKQKYPNLSQKLTEDLFKIDSKMPSAREGKGVIDWENGGELQFSGGSEENWFTMNFGSPIEMADQLDKFAAFVKEHGQDKVAGEERGNGVSFGDDDLGFDVNFDEVQSPEYYKDLAKFMRQHPGLKLNANQD
jgi:hypothetical protein